MDMMGNTTIPTEAESAETMQFEDAHIEGFEVRDDGSVEYTVVQNKDAQAELVGRTDTGDDDAQEPDKSGGDADPDADGDLDGAHATDDDHPLTKQDGNKTLHRISGEYRSYNAIQTKIKKSDATRPDDTRGEVLAEVARKHGLWAENDENGGTENDDTDTSQQPGSSTDSAWPDVEYLKNHGVEDEHIENVREAADDGRSQCAQGGCGYATQSEDADLCVGCQGDDDDSQSDESDESPPCDNRSMSDLKDFEKKLVKNEMKETGCGPQEAISRL